MALESYFIVLYALVFTQVGFYFYFLHIPNYLVSDNQSPTSLFAVVLQQEQRTF